MVDDDSDEEAEVDVHRVVRAVESREMVAPRVTTPSWMRLITRLMIRMEEVRGDDLDDVLFDPDGIIDDLMAVITMVDLTRSTRTEARVKVMEITWKAATNPRVRITAGKDG